MLFKSAAVVQDLRYTYDPVGNITRIEDAALNTTVASRQRRLRRYTYDALYRLIAASGREHSGQTAFALSPDDASWRDYPFAGARVHPNDLQGGLRDYVERYRYDSVGNIMQLAHHAGSNIDQPGQVLWQRRYQYALDSNRLLATSLPSDPDNLPDYAEAGGYTGKVHPRRPRQHDAHAAPAADALGFQRPAQCQLAAGGERRHAGDHLLRLRRRRPAGPQGHRDADRRAQERAPLPGRLRDLPRVQRRRTCRWNARRCT